MKTVNEFLNEVCDSLGLDPGELKLADTPETVEEWDSVGHLSILSTVDEFLGVEIDSEEMQNFKSIQELVERLQAKGALSDG